MRFQIRPAPKSTLDNAAQLRYNHSPKKSELQSLSGHCDQRPLGDIWLLFCALSAPSGRQGDPLPAVFRVPLRLAPLDRSAVGIADWGIVVVVATPPRTRRGGS